MRIYCDMDDIVCETAATLCGLVRCLFGVEVRYEDVHAFDLQQSFGLTSDQMRRFMDEAHRDVNLLAYPETPGAVAGLRALVAAGHRVEIVTGRPATSFRATEAWLARAGLGDLPVTYVNKYGRLFCADGDAPEMVPMGELARRGYDVAIDDSPMVLPALASWPRTRVLVFDRPWNRAVALAPNMTRVHDWRDIRAVLG